MVKKFYHEVRQQLEKNLEQAIKLGEFKGNAYAMSLTLMTILQGLSIYGKLNTSKEDSDAIIKNILEMIR